MKNLPLTFNDAAALGATHLVQITHEDLTETTADTDQTLTIAVEDGDAFRVVGSRLVTPFADASDADFNDTKLSAGDGGSATRFLPATQINGNGSEVDYAPGALGVAYPYNTPDTVDFLVESMTGKSLSDLDQGEVLLFVQLVDLAEYGPYS